MRTQFRRGFASVDGHGAGARGHAYLATLPPSCHPYGVVAGVAEAEQGSRQWQADGRLLADGRQEPLPSMKDCAEHNAFCGRIGVRSMSERSAGEAHDFEGTCNVRTFEH